jgi:hypothetical protein
MRGLGVIEREERRTSSEEDARDEHERDKDVTTANLLSMPISPICLAEAGYSEPKELFLLRLELLLTWDAWLAKRASGTSSCRLLSHAYRYTTAAP